MHVREMVVGDATITDHANAMECGKALLRVMGALGERNGVWVMLEEVVEAVWGRFV